MKYRLGLDMGATSIGWAVFDMDENVWKDMGVRIFDDGRADKSKLSLCVERRQARGMRRLTDRRHVRTRELLEILTGLGLFPSSAEEREKLKLQDPYELRAKALDGRLSLFELGRVLMQLSKRKGFLSNRKDDKKEGGKLAKGNEELEIAMKEKGARTYGEFLYLQKQENERKGAGKIPPIRLKNCFDDKGKFTGGLFPFRKNYKEEFEQIWKKQAEFYPSVLTEENKEKIKSLLFFQRPLKETEEGECVFEKGEKRIPRAHPLFQEFRIWQNILNLQFYVSYEEERGKEKDKELPLFSKEILNHSSETKEGVQKKEDKGLTKEKTEELAFLLKNPAKLKPDSKGIVSFGDIKEILGLDKEGTFNYEGKGRKGGDFEKGLLVDTTQRAMEEYPEVAAVWNGFSDEEKGALIYFLFRPGNCMNIPPKGISIEAKDNLIQKYLQDRFGFSERAARLLWEEVDLEQETASLSEKAIRKILPFMKAGQMYSDACESAGYHHSNKQYEHLDKLPYYGEVLGQVCLGKKSENPRNDAEKYGKINNATVHVALNQLRYLVNELIDRYGKPYDIAVEYARDLPAGAEERLKIQNKQKENEEKNKKIEAEIKEKLKDFSPSKEDIRKYKIWERQGKICPYTGVAIGIEDLFKGQKFQIEHILPFSRTLDNGMDNKVISAIQANYDKGNRTPYEAFHDNPGSYRWNEIKKRVKKLPPEMQWRFNKNAMKKLDEMESPIARSLNDTRYMTRLLQDYLLPIVREDGKQRVQAVSGILTAMVRKAWGLNLYKNKEENSALELPEQEEKKDKKEDLGYRAFHNHHAIDAAVVAAISRGQISGAAHDLKQVPEDVRKQFKEELLKLYLPSEQVSKEGKAEIKKKVKEAVSARKEGILKQYFPVPEKISVPDILERAAKINISHKPSLKDIRQENSTVGQLHEDTAYGFKKFEDDTSLLAMFKGPKKNKDEKVADAEEPKTKKRKKEKNIKKITEYIPIFYHREDKKAYYDAFKEWFVLDGLSGKMQAKGKEQKDVKNAFAEKERAAVLRLREASLKAFKWFIGGNNYCAEIYQVNPMNKAGGLPTSNRGKWESEIVSNYNATIRHSRGEEISYWRYKYPNAKRIMTLRRNDMVLATFSREQAFEEDFPKGLQEYVRKKFNKDDSLEKVDILLRVKKMSSAGVIALTPHDIAKEEGDKKSFLATAESLQKYNVRKVHVTFTGRIQNAK